MGGGGEQQNPGPGGSQWLPLPPPPPRSAVKAQDTTRAGRGGAGRGAGRGRARKWRSAGAREKEKRVSPRAALAGAVRSRSDHIRQRGRSGGGGVFPHKRRRPLVLNYIRTHKWCHSSAAPVTHPRASRCTVTIQVAHMWAGAVNSAVMPTITAWEIVREGKRQSTTVSAGGQAGVSLRPPPSGVFQGLEASGHGQEGLAPAPPSRPWHLQLPAGRRTAATTTTASASPRR